MRFCDLFISYKIGLNNINNPTSFNKRLFYTKFFIILSVFTAIYLTFILFNQTFYTCILVVMVIFLIVMSYILHYRNRDIKAILENSYIPYSKKRMNMIIDILKNYKININDLDSLNILIDEAKHAQIQCDYLLPFKKPIKTLGAIIVAIVSFLANKMSDVAKPNEIIYINIQILIIASLIYFLIITLRPLLKDFLYRDYNKYDEFIDDLRQIKLFYAKKQ
jgi:hypothetical protein